MSFPPCVLARVVWRFYCRKSTKYRAERWTQSGKCKPTATSTPIFHHHLAPHNGFSSVVYVILLFHIVRSSFFNRHPHRSSSWNRVTRGIFRGFLGWIWFFDPSFYFFSTCTHSSFKKNVIWIGNDNWWCTNLKIKSKMWDKNYIRMEIIGSWTTKIINIFVRDIWFLFPRRNYLCSNLVNERIEEKLLSVFISR